MVQDLIGIRIPARGDCWLVGESDQREFVLRIRAVQDRVQRRSHPRHFAVHAAADIEDHGQR